MHIEKKILISVAPKEKTVTMGKTSPATDHKPALLSHTYGHYLQQ